MLLRHAMGSVLRRIRTERGATLRQLSERSRISIPYLSEIERGRKEASSEILAALCRVLEVTEGELLTLAAAEFAGPPVLSLVPEPVVEPPHEVAEAARPAGALLLAA